MLQLEGEVEKKLLSPQLSLEIMKNNNNKVAAATTAATVQSKHDTNFQLRASAVFFPVAVVCGCAVITPF